LVDVVEQSKPEVPAAWIARPIGLGGGGPGLAILRDWLFRSALRDDKEDCWWRRLIPIHRQIGPPAPIPGQGTVDEVQAMVEARAGQSADIFQIVSGAGAQGTRTTHAAVAANGNTPVGSPSQPKEVIVYDAANGTPYSLRITNG
jgi:hypothetical protein